MAGDDLNALITELPATQTPGADGPLVGRSLLVKDLIDTAGIRTTYGSRLFADHVPARDATVVERTRAAGALLCGKANLPEFAWSVLGQNPWYGTVRNPRAPGRTTCGSSSGNGAALAAGSAELAIGTDTGGSIRLPSAACGTVGLKPALGTIPLDGVFPLCPSYDTVGPMARTVADVALLWSVLARRPLPEPRLSGLVVGLLREAPGVGDGRPGPRSDLAAAWAAGVEANGARVVEATLPAAPGDTWPIFMWEAARSHDATYPARAGEYGELMRRKLELAAAVDEAQTVPAYRALAEWRRLVPAVDVYLCPCIAVPLPAEDADELAARVPLAAFTRWVNQLGWAGLAIGNAQLVAPADETVLAAGLAWEAAGLGIPAAD